MTTFFLTDSVAMLEGRARLLGGVRHLIWDTGRGFALSTVDALCWLTLVLSLALTAAIWVGAWYLKGAL